MSYLEGSERERSRLCEIILFNAKISTLKPEEFDQLSSAIVKSLQTSFPDTKIRHVDTIEDCIKYVTRCIVGGKIKNSTINYLLTIVEDISIDEIKNYCIKQRNASVCIIPDAASNSKNATNKGDANSSDSTTSTGAAQTAADKTKAGQKPLPRGAALGVANERKNNDNNLLLSISRDEFLLVGNCLYLDETIELGFVNRYMYIETQSKYYFVQRNECVFINKDAIYYITKRNLDLFRYTQCLELQLDYKSLECPPAPMRFGRGEYKRQECPLKRLIDQSSDLEYNSNWFKMLLANLIDLRISQNVLYHHCCVFDHMPFEVLFNHKNTYHLELISSFTDRELLPYAVDAFVDNYAKFMQKAREMNDILSQREGWIGSRRNSLKNNSSNRSNSIKTGGNDSIETKGIDSDRVETPGKDMDAIQGDFAAFFDGNLMGMSGSSLNSLKELERMESSGKKRSSKELKIRKLGLINKHLNTHQALLLYQNYEHLKYVWGNILTPNQFQQIFHSNLKKLCILFPISREAIDEFEEYANYLNENQNNQNNNANGNNNNNNNNNDNNNNNENPNGNNNNNNANNNEDDDNLPYFLEQFPNLINGSNERLDASNAQPGSIESGSNSNAAKTKVLLLESTIFNINSKNRNESKKNSSNKNDPNKKKTDDENKPKRKRKPVPSYAKLVEKKADIDHIELKRKQKRQKGENDNIDNHMQSISNNLEDEKWINYNTGYLSNSEIDKLTFISPVNVKLVPTRENVNNRRRHIAVSLVNPRLRRLVTNNSFGNDSLLFNFKKSVKTFELEFYVSEVNYSFAQRFKNAKNLAEAPNLFALTLNDLTMIFNTILKEWKGLETITMIVSHKKTQVQQPKYLYQGIYQYLVSDLDLMNGHEKLKRLFLIFRKSDDLRSPLAWAFKQKHVVYDALSVDNLNQSNQDQRSVWGVPVKHEFVVKVA